MAQHHGGREQHCVRVGEPLAGDVGRRAMDRFVQPESLLVKRGRGQQTHGAAQHGGLVGKDVAKQVFGQQHVKIRRTGQKVH